MQRRRLSLPLSLLVIAAAAAAAAPPAAAAATRTAVILDHDGNFDDYVTLMLLLSQRDRIELLGVTVADGDCVPAIAANTTLKLLRLLGAPGVPVAVTTLRPANPFPLEYRAQGLSVDVLPQLNDGRPTPPLAPEPAQELLAHLLREASRPVTLVVTGPPTNLADVISQHPELAASVERVWLMGGALRVRGNVREPGRDGTAEWNSYADPEAMGVLFNSSVDLVLVPLDATNKLPITPEFVRSFGPQAEHLYSVLAGTMYSQVVSWSIISKEEPYYAWDVLTAACFLGSPGLCTFEHGLEVAVVLSGPGQGATIVLDPQRRGCPLGARAVAAAGNAVDGTGGAAVRRLASVECEAPLPAARSSANTRLSAAKMVTAVVDVDAEGFGRFVLKAFSS